MAHVLWKEGDVLFVNMFPHLSWDVNIILSSAI